MNWEKDRVLAYTIEFKISKTILYFSKEEDITTLTILLRRIFEYGYCFNTENFVLEKIDGISSILSKLKKKSLYFKDDSEKVLLKIVYLLYFKRNIETDFNSSNNFIKISRGCSLETFNLLYKYYHLDIQRIDYSEIACLQEKFNDKNSYNKEVYVGNVEKDEVKIFNDEIVNIYKDSNSPKLKFIAENIDEINFYTFSNILSIVYNSSGEIIGYRYVDYLKNAVSILDQKFNSTFDIFKFIHERLEKFLINAAKISNKIDFGISNDIYLFEIVKKDISKKQDTFSFISIDSFIDFLIRYKKEENKCYYNTLITQSISFYSNYIKEVYPALSNICDGKLWANFKSYELCKLKELRYLTAGLADEIINYIATGTTTEDFENNYNKFINNYSGIIIDGKEYPYYNGYYNANIIFMDELKSKYNVSILEDNIIIKGKEKSLISCNTLVNYESDNYPKEIYDVQKTNLAIIKKYFPDLEKYCVTVDQVVYSVNKREEKDKSMYKFEGYISDKIIGKSLTDEFLSNLDNKNLAYLNFCIFKLFKNEFISIDNIYYDIYSKKIQIDVLSSKIKIVKKNQNAAYLKYIVRNIGYSNIILDRIDNNLLNIRTYNQYLKYESELNGYCNKHNLYYNEKNGNCPMCSKYCLNILDVNNITDSLIVEDEEATYLKASLKGKDIFIKCFKRDIDIERKVEILIGQEKLYNIQKLFTPSKIIYSNDKFVGYSFIYDNEDIKFIKLTDYEKIGNLMRIKGCKMLIDKVISLINNGYTFWRNPFGLVLFVEGYQEAFIVNTECIKSGINNQDIINTIKYTINYVKEVIQNDENINLTIPVSEFSMERLEELRQKLIDYESKLNKYCSKHGFYESKYFCCPKCIKQEEQKEVFNKIIYLEDINNKFLNFEINEGGEATIYRYYPGKVIKVFKDKEIDLELKTQIIYYVLKKNNYLKKIENKVRKDGIYKFKYITIDRIIFNRKENKLHSYLMKEINAINFSILKNRKSVEEELHFSRKDIIELLINAGKGIEYLHSLNIFIGDLNSRNIMFDKNKIVYFIDFDGMSVDGLYSNVFTDQYIDPISKNNATITMKDDWYSFAIQAFYYLTYFHPFNGIEHGNNDEIEDRMEKRNFVIFNPNIEIPKVAIDWSWMPKELIDKFKSIFEGECRESIVPLLEDYYNIVYGEKYNTGINVTKKREYSVAKNSDKKNNFEILDITSSRYNNLVKIINRNSYIAHEIDNDKYILKDVNFPQIAIPLEKENIENLVDVVINSKNCFIIYKNQVDIYWINNIKKSLKLFFTLDENIVIINKNTMYSSNANSNIIEKTVILDDFNYIANIIKFEKKLKIKAISVENNSKFVIVKEDKKGIQYVYCNDELFYTFEDSSNSYNILFDNETKKWLVIRNDGKGIVIYNDAHYDEIKVPNVESENIVNLKWDYDMIYIPKKDKLLLYNTISNMEKEFELKNIIDENSKIKLDKNGFEIINKNKLYKCMFK